MKKKVADFCFQILTKSHCNQFPFHNVTHTEEVVSQVAILCNHLVISEEEQELIEIAAWFHDTGFRETYAGHEAISVKIATSFLEQNGYPSEKIQLIISCIEATKMPQRPSNLYAQILCDADVLHISQPQFFYRKLLLRREWELILNQYYADIEWHRLNLQFLHNHEFFTSYGKSILQEGKDLNEEKVRNILRWYGGTGNHFLKKGRTQN